MRVEIITFDGFDELDVFGPFEAIDAPGIDVALVAIGAPRTVVSARGVPLRIEQALGEPDGIVVPGGGWLDRSPEGAWAEAQRGELPDALRAAAERGAWIASVCTGAFLLGAAGLLAGRDATTNTHALVELEAVAGRVLRERVVDAGPVVTANGPTAGIDLGLHLVERLLGTAAADAQADGLETTRHGRVWHAAG